MGHPGNYQNQNFMQQQQQQQPFIPPNMPQQQPPPFMSHAGAGFVPQNNATFNPMFPVHGQGGPQITHNAQILAQNILNLLQQPNMNMPNMNVPNPQFCPPGPYPMQNMMMNQQLPPMQMQRQNPTQVVPYGMQPGQQPMFGFPNQQVPHAMVPQNPMFNGNPQFGMVPGNQVRPQIDPNEKNRVPGNGNANGFVPGGPFPPQQLQANDGSVPHNANNAQGSAFRNSHSQENPNSNMNTNFANSNWKGSPNKNFKNKQNRGGPQGGFQKSKFNDNNKGKRFSKEHKGKGPNNERAGHFGLNSEQEPKRSFALTYSEQEIQQWREARRKNHPSREKIEKKQGEQSKDSMVIDRELLQRELKEVLTKQAELGVEVAEIPSYYLKNGTNQGLQSEDKKNTFTDKRKFKNKVKRNPDRKSWNNKKQKFADRDLLENKKKPTLLQKLLSADIKRDKSHLFQVFRFITANSFFKDYPDKPLVYPPVSVKEMGSEVYSGKKHLQGGEVVLEHGTKEIVQNVVKDSGSGHDNEDEESDEGDNGDGINEFDEEEGEIIE